MTVRTLNVYFNQNKVGILEEKNGKSISFIYNHLATDIISLSMPLSTSPYGKNLARPFFENLLPEGDVLSHIARLYNVSEKNPFSLLGVIGEDCAGALRLIPDANPYKEQLPKVIEHDTFTSWITKNKDNIFNYQKGMRLSIAGVQNKTTLLIHDNTYYAPNFSFPSSHILKFENPNFKDMLANEYFVTSLAKRLGLPVSELELHHMDTYEYLLIKRFDRVVINDKLSRIHQEDFCQILSVPSANKYQKEGGPSLASIVEAIKKHLSFPFKDILLLAKITVFNYLVGNCDYHAKNLSVLHDDGYKLTPFYDLVSTYAFDDIDSDVAMSINKKYGINQITRNDFITMFDSWGIGGRKTLDLILKEFDHITTYADELAVNPLLDLHQDHIKKIIDIIKIHYKKLA